MIASPVSAAGFGTLAQHFTDRTIVTYDPRGVERSKRADVDLEVTPDVHAADVRAVIEAVGRSPVDLSIGTFAHETGHLLCRFPDLYDYGERDGDFEKSAGIGVYCLMGSGNHLGQGRAPAAISGYLRDLAGWPDEVVPLDPGEHELRQGDYARVHRFSPPGRVNEYFVVENRSGLGTDASLPSSVLAVFHCDTLGSNEWEDGTRERHYQLALVQAD